MGAMKGIIGERKGLLRPYPEFCEKMELPSGYLLTYVNSWNGEYMYFEFAEIEECEFKLNLLFRKRNNREIYLRMHRDEFNKKLGVTKEMGNYFCGPGSGPRVSLCLKDKQSRIIEFYRSIEAQFALGHNQDLWVWISRSNKDLEEYFEPESSYRYPGLKNSSQKIRRFK